MTFLIELDTSKVGGNIFNMGTDVPVTHDGKVVGQVISAEYDSSSVQLRVDIKDSEIMRRITGGGKKGFTG